MKVLSVIISAAVVLAAGGCVYKGAKVVEGTDIAAGLNMPGSEGALQLQLFNYLSGFRLGVDKNARLTVDYMVSETNTFLGVFTSGIAKTVRAKVEPCKCDPCKCDPCKCVKREPSDKSEEPPPSIDEI